MHAAHVFYVNSSLFTAFETALSVMAALLVGDNASRILEQVQGHSF